jgi:hypothetical protein
MLKLERLLSGGDLRSIGKVDSVISKIHSQGDFDELFHCMFHQDRIVVMRAADAIEKITIDAPSYLAKHKKEILALCETASNKELKWHLALLISRLRLAGKELASAWHTLRKWATDEEESRIVRVNSLQTLFELATRHSPLSKDLEKVFVKLEREDIPSIKARIRILRQWDHIWNKSSTRIFITSKY